MKLYDYYRSSCAYRVRIALAVKQLDYTAIKVDLTQDEQHAATYLDTNPQALVPSLLDGDHIITQSLAIIEYLNEQYPTPPLLPSTPLERAQVRGLALMIACDIHPLNNLRVLNTLRNDWQANPDQITQWYHHWLKEGLGAIERKLAKNTRKKLFCYTDNITLADLCLIPQVYNAKRFECSLEPYPIIQSIYEHCTQLSAFITASPQKNEAK